MSYLKIMLVSKNANLPSMETTGSAGYDLHACLDKSVILNPGETKLIGSGIALAIESGYAGFIYARSGLGIKKGIIPANCVGVIDSDYRGEIKIGLKNTSTEPFAIQHGDRIAQLVITRCETFELLVSDSLDDTMRGNNGFGSTGK